MLPFLVLALVQQGGPTVGDTVWVTHEVRVPVGIGVRPRPLEPTGAMQPLGPPEVVTAGRGVTVRYPLVFWRPGRHRVELPGVILVRADGWSDTLVPAVSAVEITSVLPGPPTDTTAPAPAFEVVARSSPSPLPVVVLLGAALLVLAPLHWRWRRRGKPQPVRPAPPPAVDRATIAAWTAAGEWRAAAEAWALVLQRRLDGREDPAVEALVARLRAARFGQGGPADLPGLCGEAERLAGAG